MREKSTDTPFQSNVKILRAQNLEESWINVAPRSNGTEGEDRHCSKRRISAIQRIEEQEEEEEEEEYQNTHNDDIDNEYIASMSTTGSNSLILSEHEPANSGGLSSVCDTANDTAKEEADFNLTASLTTLISGAALSGSRPNNSSEPRPATLSPNVKRKLRPDLVPTCGRNLDSNSVRIFSERELLSKCNQDSSGSESSSAPKHRRRSVGKDGSRWYGSEIDLITMTIAAASLSVVAGLSFGAGYAVGKRSVK